MCDDSYMRALVLGAAAAAIGAAAYQVQINDLHSPVNRAAATLAYGAAFLVACDLAARTIFAPVEMPVGIVTAMVGAPFFLWLLVRRA